MSVLCSIYVVVVGYWVETDHIWAVAAGNLENWSPFAGDQKREGIKKEKKKIFFFFFFKDYSKFFYFFIRVEKTNFFRF